MPKNANKKKAATKAKLEKATDPHVIKKLKLNLEIMRSQQNTWKLRAKAKTLRIQEVERDIRRREGRVTHRK